MEVPNHPFFVSRSKCSSFSRRALLLGGSVAALGGTKTPGSAAQTAPAAAGMLQKSRGRIAVIGAGVFGGWTALSLARSGAQVTLIDAWGPGNSRASSGGETRVIRVGYGADRVYSEMAARALELWKAAEKEWGNRFFFPIGALWMSPEKGEYLQTSSTVMRELGMEVEELSKKEASRRFTQVDFEGIDRVMLEKDAGCLLARRACHMVLNSFLKAGGEYRQAAVITPVESDSLVRLPLNDGSSVEAEQYVFACGPWLASLFPDLLRDKIVPTRQEIFYFGTPAGDRRFDERDLPAWVDLGEPLYYGIPGNEWRGFKLADDSRGPLFDPTAGDRSPSEKAIEAARGYLGRRFPGMQGAPLVEARVCQFEQSPDGHFILDRHPEIENAWLVGGGSGHGYKHGPALGEKVARMVLGETPVDPFFSLARFRYQG